MRRPFAAAGRLWAKRHNELRLTWGTGVALGLVVSLPVAAAIMLGSLAMVRVAEEANDRNLDRAEDRRQVEAIARRVVRIERQPSRGLIRRLERNLTLCRRFPECAAALDQQPQRDRRDRDRDADIPTSDRPPRPPVPPVPAPDPNEGGPEPHGGAAPVPSSPSPGAPPGRPSASPIVDIPPVDLDDDGVLPPIDVPPIHLP
jgi:hypothetical protein